MAQATKDPPTGTDPDADEGDQKAIDAVNAQPENAGRSIEDIAAAGETGEDEAGQTYLDFGDAVNLKLAGKKPSLSKIKIRAISREIKGQLGDKGDDEEVFVLVRATLDEVTTKTFRDDNRRVRNKERRHVLEPVGVVKLPDDVAEALFDQYA